MTSGRQAGRVQIGLSAELCDSRSHPICVLLLFRGMLQKLVFRASGVDAAGHVIMSFVAQHADKFGRKHFVQNLDHCRSIGFVAFSYCALLHMHPGTFADAFDVGYEIAHLALHWNPSVCRTAISKLLANAKADATGNATLNDFSDVFPRMVCCKLAASSAAQ